jgi:hypothetical protein
LGAFGQVGDAKSAHLAECPESASVLPDRRRRRHVGNSRNQEDMRQDPVAHQLETVGITFAVVTGVTLATQAPPTSARTSTLGLVDVSDCFLQDPPEGKPPLAANPQERHVSTDAPDWNTLGDLLVTRRVQIHSQYKNRRKFVADTHGGGSATSWYRLITSIETGSRDNYSRETLAAMEVAYQLEPGSLARSARSRVLEPKRQVALAQHGSAGFALQPEPSTSDIERQVLDHLRAQAEAADKSIGDILVERGLASAEELTLSEEKRGDRLVKDILESDLPEESKNVLLMDYVGARRHHFREAGLIEGAEEK